MTKPARRGVWGWVPEKETMWTPVVIKRRVTKAQDPPAFVIDSDDIIDNVVTTMHKTKARVLGHILY